MQRENEGLKRDLRRMEEKVDRVNARTQRVPMGRRGGGGGGRVVFKSAETKVALDAILLEGEIGYTTGATKYYYCKLDGVTIAFSHTE